MNHPHGWITDYLFNSSSIKIEKNNAQRKIIHRKSKSTDHIFWTVHVFIPACLYLISPLQILNSSNMEQHFCHCGRSFTTYHGLRVHQGKMGCTPKGMRIPESGQSSFHPMPAFMGSLIRREPSMGMCMSLDYSESTNVSTSGQFVLLQGRGVTI